jgi:hypothetical protein
VLARFPPIDRPVRQNAEIVGSSASNPRDASPQNPSSDLTNSGNPDNLSGQDANPSSPAQPPVIQINGENPAHFPVGETYNDLGATITGPQADINLGIKTFLNGELEACRRIADCVEELQLRPI